MLHRCLLLLVLSVGSGGCSSSSPAPLPPQWPTPASANLAVELRATARERALATSPSLGERDSIEPVVDAPLVAAIVGESAGLTYIEVVLGKVDIDASLPMVMMLHGRGDQPRVPGGPFACVTMPMRIIIPRAPDPLGPGYTWLSVRVAEGRTDELSDQLIGRADQLASLLADVSSRRPTLGRPIVTGFSQGGLLTFALAVRHSTLMAAAFPLAGWLPPPLWPDSAADLPVIRSVHGLADDVIPLAPTRDAVVHLKQLGVDIELLEFEDVGHAMSGAMNAQFERWLQPALRNEAPPLASWPHDTEVELGAQGEIPRCS